MFWNRRVIRIGVGLALLILGLIVILPTITGYTSLDGTVNARLINVAAPIEGTVINPAPPAGDALTKGEHLLSIRNDRVNRYQLSELIAELRATQDTLKAMALQQGGLESLRNELQQRFETYRDAMVRNTDKEIIAQQERIGANESRAEERKSDLSRKQRLQVSGHLSESELDRTRSTEDVARHELDASHNELERLKAKREAAQKGIFIEEGRNDVPYSIQRIDEVTIALASLATRRGEQEARLIKLRQQIADEEDRVQKLGYASLRSELDGVMWRNYVVVGSNVVVGHELLSILNCHDLFVDIIVHEVDYDDIYPGRDAEVRLLGRDNSIPGRVAFVRGSRADFEDKISAASLPRTEGKYAKIRVELSPSELNTDFENFCQVGRSAQVRFRTRSIPFLRWLRSLWFTIS
jgi:multidrug resistance efflux pump